MEMLVVLAVIAVLAGLLLPGLQRALQTAQTTRCASNLRQIGMAFQQWSNDNDGQCLTSYEPPYPNTPWMWLLRSYVPGGTNSTIWICPAQPHKTTAQQWPIPAWTTTPVDYAQNEIQTPNVGGWINTTGQVRAAAIAGLSQKVNLAEGKNVFYSLASWNAQVVPYATVHHGGSNMLFLDGHVSWFFNPTEQQVAKGQLW